MKSKLVFAGALSAALLCAGQALAAIPYVPSSNMPVLGGYSLNRISNGDTTAADGFASTKPTGKIKFTLERCGLVKSFAIYNNVNGTTNGVKSFTLRYYTASGTLIGTQTQTITQAMGIQVIAAPVVPLMQFVKSIEMEVTASFEDRVEIREVVIDGDPGPCCP